MTNVTVETKKTLVTLKSSLEAHNIDQLAVVLANMAGDKAALQKFALTFSLAAKEGQKVLKDRAAELEKAKEEAEKRREERKAAKQAEAQAVLEERKQEAETMLKDIVDKMGLDLEVAQEMVTSAMAKKYPVQEEKSFTFNRTAVIVNGETYQMGVTGNMPQVLKDALNTWKAANEGKDRPDFIIAHAVDVEEAKEIIALKNGANA